MRVKTEREYIALLEAALREVRRPIICSIFGMPDEEVSRLVTLIDSTLKGRPEISEPEAESEREPAVLLHSGVRDPQTGETQGVRYDGYLAKDGRLILSSPQDAQRLDYNAEILSENETKL